MKHANLIGNDVHIADYSLFSHLFLSNSFFGTAQKSTLAVVMELVKLQVAQPSDTNNVSKIQVPPMPSTIL